MYRVWCVSFQHLAKCKIIIIISYFIVLCEANEYLWITFPLCVSLFFLLQSLAFPSHPLSTHVLHSPMCMSSYCSPSLLYPVPFSPLHLPLHTHSTPLCCSPQPHSPLPNPTPLSPFSSIPSLSPHRYASIPSWQLHLLPASPLSFLSLSGWFPQLWWVRGRWPENWPLGEHWAILVLLGSWLIIGVSDRGKINQGESWGMFRAALFTHRPRWMKLHLSVFSCITPKLVVYSFFSLPPLRSLSSLLFLSLPSFMCQWLAKWIQWWNPCHFCLFSV